MPSSRSVGRSVGPLGRRARRPPARGAAAREGGRGPVLARRSRYDHRQNWWRLSGPTFLRGPPCSKLGGGRPGAAAGGRRGATSLSGHSQKVAFTSKSQRKRLQTGRAVSSPVVYLIYRQQRYIWETSSAYLRAGPNSVRALERNRTQPLRSCSYPHVRPTSTERRARSKSQKQKGERTCDLA